jgi:hypothetical protein
VRGHKPALSGKLALLYQITPRKNPRKKKTLLKKRPINAYCTVDNPHRGSSAVLENMRADSGCTRIADCLPV